MVQDESRQVAEYWDRIAPKFDSIYTGEKNPVARGLDKWLRRDMYERFNWVVRRAGDCRGQSICDVGCGSGRFVNVLAQKGARVTGLDFAPTMLKLSQELVQCHGVADRCDFVLSDVLDWKTDRKFDLVIAIGFWDYVADPLPRLQMIRSITRARFLSAWPRSGTWRAAIRKVRLNMAGCPVYFWTRPQVEEYLNRAGFRVSSWEQYGQLYCAESKAV
jgi:ubiquinone/menaquinone biosynthesis C-methylase UbiE